MFVEFGSGCLFLACYGLYQFWQQPQQITVPVEKPPKAHVFETDSFWEYWAPVLLVFDEWVTWKSPVTNWIVVTFWVVAVSVAIWNGILKWFSCRRNLKLEQEDLRLSDLDMQQEEDQSFCNEEESHYNKTAVNGDLANNNLYKSPKEVHQSGKIKKSNLSKSRIPKPSQTDLLSNRSYAFDNSDMLDGASASFLSGITGKDKIKVDRILNSRNQNSFDEDDSNLCAMSMSSRGQTGSCASTKDSERSTMQRQNPSVPAALGSSFGDVTNIDRPRAPRSLSKDSFGVLSYKQGGGAVYTPLGSTTFRGNTISEKPPSGNKNNSAVKQSKIPIKRTSSVKRINDSQKLLCSERSNDIVPSRSSSLRSDNVPNEGKSDCELQSAHSRISSRRSSLVKHEPVSDSANEKEKVDERLVSNGNDAQYLSTGSDESEVSIQSLLDQSEVSLLTSSPEANLPNLHLKHNNRLQKSNVGQTLDERFNTLLDVVIKHNDDIKTLYRASSKERSRSKSQNKSFKHSNSVRNRPRSCPRGNNKSFVDTASGCDSVTEKSSSNYCGMYGNYMTANGVGANWNLTGSRMICQRGPNGRLRNPPMRFRNEDKTVFLAAGHFRPSDIEIIRQRRSLRHVGMNLTK